MGGDGGHDGANGQSSGKKNGVSAPPGDIWQERGPCRALVGRGRKRGPETRKLCSRLEKESGSGRCGNHKTADLIPADRMPSRALNLQRKCDRTQKGAGEGTESYSDDGMEPYYGEEGPLQGEAMGQSRPVPDDMVKVIAASHGIKEEAYRKVYIDVGLAKHDPEREIMDVSVD